VRDAWRLLALRRSLPHTPHPPHHGRPHLRSHRALRQGVSPRRRCGAPLQRQGLQARVLHGQGERRRHGFHGTCVSIFFSRRRRRRRAWRCLVPTFPCSLPSSCFRPVTQRDCTAKQPTNVTRLLKCVRGPGVGNYKHAVAIPVRGSDVSGMGRENKKAPPPLFFLFQSYLTHKSLLSLPCCHANHHQGEIGLGEEMEDMLAKAAGGSSVPKFIKDTGNEQLIGAFKFLGSDSMTGPGRYGVGRFPNPASLFTCPVWSAVTRTSYHHDIVQQRT
jgi:hypothetical protein